MGANSFPKDPKNHMTPEGVSDIILHKIFDNLPVGLEIYDRNGILIDINAEEMKVVGATTKDQVLGLSLFENPNLPGEVREHLLAGKDVRFSQEYDFDRAQNYFSTTRHSTRFLDVAVNITRDAEGNIDKYILISQDNTERTLSQRKYEKLFNQNMVILDSLPVGVEIYAPDGSLTYMSKTDARIFGVDRNVLMGGSLNIFQNPNLPEEVKQAVRDRVQVQAHFPYNFRRIADQGYYDSTQERGTTLQIKCNGRPVFNAAGEFENYVFIVEDITESAHQEEELRQSKRKTELAIRDSEIMLWEFDVQRRLFFSDNESMNGYDQCEPISIDLYTQTIHPEDRAASDKIIGRMLQGEDFPFTFDARILFPDNPEWQYCTVSGSPYEHDQDGRVTKFVGTRKNNTEFQRSSLLQEQILNNIPLPIHIKDVENDFRYVFCNEESMRMFGTSIDKTAYDVMTAEQVARIEKTDKEVFATGKPYLGLERIELKDGRVYDTIVRKSTIYVNGKRLLLNIRWDQSLQNDLERRAKVLSLSMEAMNAFSWFYEPEKDRVNFGEGFDRSGRTVSQLDSLKKFTDNIHSEDRQKFIAKIRDLLPRGGGEWDLEYRVDLNESGVYEWWHTRGILETTLRDDVPYQYMYGMSINIEAHKQTELTLLKNKEELNSLIRQNELVLNNTNSGLAYITMDFVVQWENISICSASLTYEAYKQGELCYKSAHGRTSPCEECVLQRTMQSRQMEQIKFRLENNNTVEVFATPVFREDGSVDGIVIRVDDITEREQMIGELHKAKAQAEQSDKLKSAFLANMSHEIRTPLNAIVGFSELLALSDDGPEKEEYMRIISNNNELLLKLINDILDLSKIEAGSVELKYEEFDLAEYFNEMAASMKQRVKNPNVRLIAVNPHADCHVRLDKNRIAQILTNYVTNAIKYTPKGYIEMGYESFDEGIRFYVRDSGIGIAKEKKDKVFHRFEKLDEFAQGTGLGLSICKAIAESMGGSVGFESADGEGSLFWAFLPCEMQLSRNGEAVPRADRPEQEPETDTTVTEVGDNQRFPRILIAEDNPSNYLLVSALLSKHFDLMHAENGQQAVDMLRENQVTLLLMDMKMPVMDGLTATAEIRKFDRKIPIIALTAHAFEADRQAAFAAGCDEYLVKPINKAKLMAVLHKYCGNSSQKK